MKIVRASFLRVVECASSVAIPTELPSSVSGRARDLNREITVLPSPLPMAAEAAILDIPRNPHPVVESQKCPLANENSVPSPPFV